MKKRSSTLSISLLQDRRARNHEACFILLGLSLWLCAGCSSHRVSVNLDAEDRYLLAKKLLAKEDCLEATEEFQKVIFNFPGSEFIDDSEFGLGEAHYCSKEYTLAAAQFQRILRDYPLSPYADDAQFMLGMCYYEQSMPSSLDQEFTRKAIDAFQKMIDDWPESDRIGEAKERLGLCRSKLAKKDYDAGILYLRLDYFDAAILTFRELIAGYSDTPWAAEAQYGIGLVYGKQKQYTDALSAFQRVLSDYPATKAAQKAKKSIEEMKKKQSEAK